MNKYKQAEMEDIFESYAWPIREKLESLDFMIRKMFVEMGVFGVPKAKSDDYVQAKLKEIAENVNKKGEAEFSNKNKQRRGKTAPKTHP